MFNNYNGKRTCLKKKSRDGNSGLRNNYITADKHGKLFYSSNVSSHSRIL